MPLDIRSNAVKVAVVTFFIVAAIAAFRDVPMCVSSYRAATAAIISYVATSWAIKALNSIIMHAMVTQKVQQTERKEDVSAG